MQTLGLLWHGFHDAVREGDGNCIIRYWHFLLPVFKQCSHRNYAIEALNLLAHMFILLPWKVAELKWSRTVNTIRRVGYSLWSPHGAPKQTITVYDQKFGIKHNVTVYEVSWNVSWHYCTQQWHRCVKTKHFTPIQSLQRTSNPFSISWFQAVIGQDHQFCSYKKHP